MIKANIQNTIIGLNVVRTINSLKEEIDVSQNDMNEIEDQIKMHEMKYKALDEMRQDISRAQSDMEKQEMREIDALLKIYTQKNSSLVELDFKIFQTNRLISVLKSKFNSLIHDDDINLKKSKSELETIFSRIDQAFSTLHKIYERIDLFKQNSDLAIFISQMSEKTSSQNFFPRAYQSELAELKKSIHASIVLGKSNFYNFLRNKNKQIIVFNKFIYL